MYYPRRALYARRWALQAYSLPRVVGMAAHKGPLIQLVHLVVYLPREHWLKHNTKPGLVGFLIIYFIHGIQG